MNNNKLITALIKINRYFIMCSTVPGERAARDDAFSSGWLIIRSIHGLPWYTLAYTLLPYWPYYSTKIMIITIIIIIVIYFVPLSHKYIYWFSSMKLIVRLFLWGHISRKQAVRVTCFTGYLNWCTVGFEWNAHNWFLCTPYIEQRLCRI